MSPEFKQRLWLTLNDVVEPYVGKTVWQRATCQEVETKTRNVLLRLGIRNWDTLPVEVIIEDGILILRAGDFTARWS